MIHACIPEVRYYEFTSHIVKPDNDLGTHLSRIRFYGLPSEKNTLTKPNDEYYTIISKNKPFGLLFGTPGKYEPYG